jgi:A/G-specific adenine glycosylase
LFYYQSNIEGELSADEALEYSKKIGLQPLRIKELGVAKHIFSHVEWHMTAYYIRCRKTNKKWKWVTKESLDETYALPSAFRPFREQIENL